MYDLMNQRTYILLPFTVGVAERLKPLCVLRSLAAQQILPLRDGKLRRSGATARTVLSTMDMR